MSTDLCSLLKILKGKALEDKSNLVVPTEYTTLAQLLWQANNGGLSFCSIKSNKTKSCACTVQDLSGIK